MVLCCCGKIDLRSIAIVILGLAGHWFTVTSYADGDPVTRSAMKYNEIERF